MAASALPADSTALLGEIRQRVRQAQTRAVLALQHAFPHIAEGPQPVAQPKLWQRISSATHHPSLRISRPLPPR